MPIAVQLKDSLQIEEIDETFAGAMNAFNLSIAKGNTFVAMSDMQGGHVMLNIPQILTVKELDD